MKKSEITESIISAFGEAAVSPQERWRDIEITNEEEGFWELKLFNQIILCNQHIRSQIQGANSIDPTKMNT